MSPQISSDHLKPRNKINSLSSTNPERGRERRTWPPVFVLALGVVAMSFASIFIRLCDAPTMAIATYRLVIASAFFLVTAKAKRQVILRAFGPGDFLLALLSAAFLSLHFATWITSLKYTSVASSVVLVQTSPIFVALGSVFILKERVSPLLVVGILLSVGGGVIIGLEDWGTGKNPFIGDVLALLGGVGGAGYWLAGRKLRLKVTTLQYVSVVYTTTAVVLLLISLCFRIPLHGFSGSTYLLLVLIALVPQVIGHTSFNWALRFLSASSVSVAALGEPVGASLLAYFILSEKVTNLKIVGGALILSGVYLALRSETNARRRNGL